MDQDESTDRARSLVTCFWCERLHPGDHALSVCPDCASRHSTMRTLQMRGSYPLDVESINTLITHASAGNYALGYLDGDDFAVFYVGRSDSDVGRRLREWVGISNPFRRYGSQNKAPWGSCYRKRFPINAPGLERVGNVASAYTHFAYSYARSAEEAYAKEWRNYDFFGGRDGLDNDTAPLFVQREHPGHLPQQSAEGAIGCTTIREN